MQVRSCCLNLLLFFQTFALRLSHILVILLLAFVAGVRKGNRRELFSLSCPCALSRARIPPSPFNTCHAGLYSCRKTYQNSKKRDFPFFTKIKPRVSFHQETYTKSTAENDQMNQGVRLLISKVCKILRKQRRRSQGKTFENVSIAESSDEQFNVWWLIIYFLVPASMRQSKKRFSSYCCVNQNAFKLDRNSNKGTSHTSVKSIKLGGN